MITERDVHLHTPTDSPYWNESCWFSFMVPERALTGFVYFHHRPNMGYSMGGVALWGDGQGEETYDCHHYDWGDPYPMAPDQDMFDVSLPNGLSVRMLEPLVKYEMSYGGVDNWYQGKGFELELSWTASKEPHLSQYVQGSHEFGAGGHWEQPGRITGTVRVDGETIPIDCWSIHDRSWGVRQPLTQPRGNMAWGIGDESSFCVIASSALTAEDDPYIGVSDPVLTGWYLRDDIYGSVQGGTLTAVERDPKDGRPLRFVLDSQDHLGRPVHATGRIRNLLNWHGYPYLYLWFSMVEWEIDGTTVYGESQDFNPVQQARRFKRSLLTNTHV